MAFWYSRVVRTTMSFRTNGDTDTGYVARAVLRITKGAKSAVGRDVGLNLTVAEARALANELTALADNVERLNKESGYLIDLPRS